MESGSTVRFKLFERHGDEMGRSLIHNFAPSLLRRLGVDPVSRADELRQCECNIHWVRRVDSDDSVTTLTIDWSEASVFGINDPALCFALPEQAVTEKAAIGLMALLVMHLEGMTVQRVLPIGTGADYELIAVDGRARYRVEVSGIRVAAYPSQLRARVLEKRQQLFTSNDCGYVSVTAFSHPPDGNPSSYLGFESQPKVTKRKHRRRK
jgi:hypothetical protein